MQQNKKGGFFSTLLGTLGDSLIGNLLTSMETIKVGEETFTSGQGF